MVHRISPPGASCLEALERLKLKSRLVSQNKQSHSTTMHLPRAYAQSAKHVAGLDTSLTPLPPPRVLTRQTSTPQSNPNQGTR
jgi:hypothetical protein